jgi:hypothetical protein
MRCLAFLSFLVILAGCKSSGEKDLPQGLMKDSIIPQTEMINILADIHIIEATLQVQHNKNGDVIAMEDFYYKKLFSNYKVSRGRFKLNLSYYEKDPENFRKMYEEVVKKLETASKMANPHK